MIHPIKLYGASILKKEAEENAEEDRKRKEQTDAINKADGLVFQTEKQMKEFDDDKEWRFERERGFCRPQSHARMHECMHPLFQQTRNPHLCRCRLARCSHKRSSCRRRHALHRC